jgi:hypothetical protein
MPRGRPRSHSEGELCELCHENEKQFHGYNAYGNPQWKKHCHICNVKIWPIKSQKGKSDSCELCGYTPLFKRTLDIHHRDGDHDNNEPENRMTLCANCHRELEGAIHEHGDWKKAEEWLRRILRHVKSRLFPSE